MDNRVRAATASDWQAVAALLAELGRPDVRDRVRSADAQDLYQTYLQRTDVEALLAETEEQVIGFVNVEFRSRLNYFADQAWIAELIVMEDRRGEGVGKALLAAAELRARQRGCWGLALESATWRTDAHLFYQREGWRQTSVAFTKLLDPTVAAPGSAP